MRPTCFTLIFGPKVIKFSVLVKLGWNNEIIQSSTEPMGHTAGWPASSQIWHSRILFSPTSHISKKWYLIFVLLLCLQYKSTCNHTRKAKSPASMKFGRQEEYKRVQQTSNHLQPRLGLPSCTITRGAKDTMLIMQPVAVSLPRRKRGGSGSAVHHSASAPLYPLLPGLMKRQVMILQL